MSCTKQNSLKFLLFVFFVSCYFLSIAQKNELANRDAYLENTNQTYLVKLPIWGAEVTFPGEAFYNETSIYTSKGVGTQKSYNWSDESQNLQLSVSYYTQSEVISTKNEKEIFADAAKKIAVRHDGMPMLGTIITNLQNIRECRLKIETLKGEQYEAKIYAKSNIIMIVDVLVVNRDKKADEIINQFFKNVDFKPLNRNVTTKTNQDGIAVWDSLFVENFYLTFPQAPISNHKLVTSLYGDNKYYEWYMRDQNNLNTYVFSVMPFSNFKTLSATQIIDKNIEETLNSTKGKLVQERDLDYFEVPVKEVIFKTKDQYFRARIFCDKNNLYQVLVSGSKDLILGKDVNRYLDGLKWVE
ncbi:MAG: hypothetical protein M9887_09065 [Chitinophagales bacterium]|nr:hypothetical protein [Chitinophagales bacterium]